MEATVGSTRPVVQSTSVSDNPKAKMSHESCLCASMILRALEMFSLLWKGVGDALPCRHRSDPAAGSLQRVSNTSGKPALIAGPGTLRWGSESVTTTTLRVYRLKPSASLQPIWYGTASELPRQLSRSLTAPLPLLLPRLTSATTMAARRAVTNRALQSLTYRPVAASPRTCKMPQAPSANQTAVRRLHATTSQLQQNAATATSSAGPSPTEYPNSHIKISQPQNTTNFIDNKFVASKADQWIDLYDPATNNLVTRVPQSTDAEMKAAVESAQKAFPAWKATSLLARQQIMFKYVALIREHWDRLAASITLEQGKTFADAKGDVLRGLQVAETACGITTQMTGELLEVSKDMETRTYREPLGIVAAICPFNFPAMIPLWTIPIACVTGNTCIIKPSERDPGAMMILAELAEKAGFPPGVVNVIHGSAKAVDFILDEPAIKAISFVGSNRAGEYIYQRGSANGKRVQANLGAKNHAAVLPDCNKNHALNAISGAAFGAAGQRCMALSTLVLVGETKDWAPEIATRAKELSMNGGFEEGTDLGPVISPQAKERIERIIGTAEKEGATIVLDGRGQKPEKYPDGNWVGPTIIANVTKDMT